MVVVCVTGASGYIASHIVSQLLEKGYVVHGTVRNVDDEKKVSHLKALPNAKENLKLFAADLVTPNCFDDAVAGCEVVFHTACPVAFDAKDGENELFAPAMKGTESVLSAVYKAGTVKTFVLTSSMAAVAPQPEPAVKSEECWSDPVAQKAKGNWYGCTKTSQEKLLLEHVAKGASFRYAAICPTGVFGPMLQPGVNATMGWIASLCKGSKEQAANDSMSFIDVRDCAAQHIAAMENPEAQGRYMSLVESLHWNDIFKMLKELYPEMPDVKPCEGEPVKPTQFDTTRMDTLGVKVRDVRTILQGAIEDLKAKGALP